MSGLATVAALVGIAFGVSAALTAIYSVARLHRTIDSTTRRSDDLYAPKGESNSTNHPVVR
jgi:hypothetical protein